MKVSYLLYVSFVLALMIGCKAEKNFNDYFNSIKNNSVELIFKDNTLIPLRNNIYYFKNDSISGNFVFDGELKPYYETSNFLLKDSSLKRKILEELRLLEELEIYGVESRENYFFVYTDLRKIKKSSIPIDSVGDNQTGVFLYVYNDEGDLTSDNKQILEHYPHFYIGKGWYFYITENSLLVPNT